MELLQRRIRQDGVIRPGNILKVDSFLNHQLDVALFAEIGKEFKNRFCDCSITKILTVEASGIGIACVVAQFFDVPVLFAKKSGAKTLAEDVYHSNVQSYTRGGSYDIFVAKQFLGPQDNVLIIDDFLAMGSAVLGLASIIEQAGAGLAGVGIVVEKGFQDGGRILRERGIRLESLAVIERMDEHTGVHFRQ